MTVTKTVADGNPDRAGVYVGETSGKTGCANDEPSPTKHRYSIRLTAAMDVGGRSEARTMNVYFIGVSGAATTSAAVAGRRDGDGDARRPRRPTAAGRP